MPTTHDPTFLFSSQRPCIAEPDATCPTMCLEQSRCPLYFSFFPAEFLIAASNLFLSTATGLYQSTFLVLAWIFSYTSSIFCVLYIHFFHLKVLFCDPVHKMKKPLDSPASFWPISLTSCISKLFEPIILLYLLFFFWSLTLYPLPARLISAPNSLLSIKFCCFLGPSQMGFNKPTSTILTTI